MFHHGYVFQTMLAEAGPLNDGQVRQHKTMQLLYGVNRPFRIRLNGEWHKARLCLLEAGVPHYINGDGDWQYCFYIYPDSHTGHLLKSAILKDSPASIYSRDNDVTGLDVMPSVVRPIPAEDLKSLFEQIVFLFTGRRSCIRPDQPLLRKLREHMKHKEVFSSSDLAALCGIDPYELADQFKRISEFNLETWLLHQRIMVLFDRLEKLKEISESAVDALARESGIAGLEALDRLFNDLFGIPYMKWVAFSVGSMILTDHHPEFFCFM